LSFLKFGLVVLCVEDRILAFTMPINTSLEVIGSVSAAASVSVIVTILRSKVMREKIFNQIILVRSLNMNVLCCLT
jgi:hypothetical protein